MTQTEGEISMFAIGTTLVRHRWSIARWIFVGGALAAISVIGKPVLYRASASFAPQGNDASKSGLASLAGQFGVALPTSSQSLSPEYYARLIKSRVLLRQIANDTVAVAEMGGRRMALMDLFKINVPDAMQREDQGALTLSHLIGTSVSKPTGIVEVSADTKWRSVSIAIVSALIDGVNTFNQQSRQAQASAERKFVEGRMAIADTELRAAEDRLQDFQKSNKGDYSRAPDLVLQRDRLERAVSQRQQVYTSLAQSYEDVRLREVRDTPVITVIEAPSAPALPEPRGRTKVGLLGIMFGGFAGVLLAMTKDMMARRKEAGDGEAAEFFMAVGSLRRDLVRPFRWLARRPPETRG